MYLDKRKLYLLMALFCVAGYVWLLLNQNQRVATRMGSVCVFKNVTGVPCPSCGATRSMKAILSGDFVAGMTWNPLGYVLLVALVVSPWWLMYDMVLRKDSLHRMYARMELVFLKPLVMGLFIVLLILNWIWNIYKGV